MTAHALAVGLDPDTVAKLALALGGEVVLEHEPRAAVAVDRAAVTRYELVACSYPLPDMLLRRFGAAIRQSASSSRDAALLVLTLRDMRGEAALGLPSGRSLVAARTDTTHELQRAAGHLLRLGPRRGCLAPVVVDTFDPAGPRLEATALNVSLSGMLVAHPTPPPVGARCVFELALHCAGAPCTGVGEVVRHALRGRRLHGFAVRFSELVTSAGDCLVACTKLGC